MTTPNEPIFTLKAIANGDSKICYIVHDEEGEWQFLNGNNVDADDLMIISMEQLLLIDNTLTALLPSIPKGYEAALESSGWVVRKFE